MSKIALATFVTVGLALSNNLRPADAAALISITLSETGTSPLTWPIFGAQAKGYFKKNGIELEVISNPSSASGMLQLTAGSVDISSNGTVDPLRAIDKGAHVTLLRLEMVPAPYQIYAKPNIHSFAELKGKAVILGGVKDITRIYFERMARSQGFPVGTYDMVFAGTAGARLSALLSGSVAAAILNPPSNFKAQAAKFSLLPAAPDFAKGVPFSVFSVNTGWAKRHKTLIAKFLAAYSEGVDWFYNPSSKQEAVDLLAKRLSISREEAERTYDFYVALKAFDRTGAITKDSIGPLLEILKRQGDIDGTTKLSRFYNPAALGLPE